MRICSLALSWKSRQKETVISISIIFDHTIKPKCFHNQYKWEPNYEGTAPVVINQNDPLNQVSTTEKTHSVVCDRVSCAPPQCETTILYIHNVPLFLREVPTVTSSFLNEEWGNSGRDLDPLPLSVSSYKQQAALSCRQSCDLNTSAFIKDSGLTDFLLWFPPAEPTSPAAVWILLSRGGGRAPASGKPKKRFST